MLVSVLISRGASPQWTDSTGWSALHAAALNGHVHVARLLLDNGWELDLANNWGGTPFHWAASNGRVSMLVFLAARGAKINTQDINKETPLHHAAERGQQAAVRLLLGLGADRSLKNMFGKTAEELCADEETRAVFTEIQDQGPKELLARAVMEQDWTTAAALYSRGVDMDGLMDESMKRKVAALAGRWYRYRSVE